MPAALFPHSLTNTLETLRNNFILSAPAHPMFGIGWMEAHQVEIGVLAAISLAMFIGSLIIVPLIIIRLPPDYFSKERPRRLFAPTFDSASRWILILLKNMLGILFLGVGLIMLLTPGQGLITLIVGIMLIDFPGKRRFEHWLIARPSVLKHLNWLRRRAKRPPLIA